MQIEFDIKNWFSIFLPILFVFLIQKGQMVNLVFGANCPELLRVLNIELERVLKGEPHEYVKFVWNKVFSNFKLHENNFQFQHSRFSAKSRGGK